MDASALRRLASRHIQNHSDADALEPHWGYADRVVPCKNDAGSCAYLDVVYDAHDVGMLHVGIFWASVGGILLLSACLKNLGRPVLRAGSGRARGGVHKVRSTLAALGRRHLLPDANHFLFGRTTRFQVVVLAILAGYLLVLSLVGIVYNTWITPVKNQAGVFNTRTSLGPWSDRVGVLAYALTPLSVLLSSRESLLSVLTGLSYQTFNFLHRWLGYIIFVQSALHTVGWCVVQIRLYQPQPSVGLEWVRQTYIAWGLVAMILLTLLVVLSTPWAIRRTGYEFFRKAHYVLAMVYVGACLAHWQRLQCFLIPSLLLWGLDRGARLFRTALLQYHPWTSGGGFGPSQATVTRFSDDQHGDVIRLDVDKEQDPWAVGQHFYLCFTECSIWQSHPFTPLNAPIVRNGRVRHSYIVRAKSGETKKLAALAARKLATNESTKGSSYAPSASVILTGPYGQDVMERVHGQDVMEGVHEKGANNIVCVAGGTGIAYVLPVLLQLARQRPMPDRKMELIWAMRHVDNTDWVRDEMDSLQRSQTALNLRIRLYATRDGVSSANKTDAVTDSWSDNAGACPDDRTGGNTHPDLPKLLGDFVESTISGRTTVFASGPGGMMTDLRTVVASLNSPSKVWRRQEKYDVDFVCDNRMEW